MKELFGFPVVLTNEVPKGEIIFGRFPTVEEVRMHGSFEKAIEAQKEQWAKIKNVTATSNDLERAVINAAIAWEVCEDGPSLDHACDTLGEVVRKLISARHDSN